MTAARPTIGHGADPELSDAAGPLPGEDPGRRIRTLGRGLGKVSGGIALALVLLFLFAPLIATVYVAFSPVVYAAFPPRGVSLRWFSHLLHTPELLEAFARSIVIALIVTPLTGLLATAAGLGLERTRRSGRALGRALFQAPLIVPELIFGIALLAAYALTGLNGTYVGLIIAHVVIAFPFFLRSVDVSLVARDRAQEEAAAVLGATPMRVLRTVTIPAIRAGLMSGAVFSFVVSFDQFSVSLFVVDSHTETLPVAIYNYLFQNNDPTVAAVSTVIIVLGFIAAAVTQRLVGLDRMIVGDGQGRVSA